MCADDPVTPDLHTITVHQEDPDHVVHVEVLLYLVALRVHEVERIAASRHLVPRNVVGSRVPDHHVAHIGDEVVDHLVLTAIPKPDGITTDAQVHLLGADPVAPDQVRVGLGQVHAEEAIVDPVLLDDIAIAADLHAGIQSVVIRPGAGDVEAP